MTAFKPIGSFVHEFVTLTRVVWPSHMSHSGCYPELLIQNSSQGVVLFPPEECVWNQEHHFHPVSSQLDSVWAGGHVPVQECVCSPAGAQFQCHGRGGLVPAGGSAAAEEVLTKCRSFDARKHQTDFPSSVVRTSILIEPNVIFVSCNKLSYH